MKSLKTCWKCYISAKFDVFISCLFVIGEMCVLHESASLSAINAIFVYKIWLTTATNVFATKSTEILDKWVYLHRF